MLGIQRLFQQKALVLMYHKIATPQTDPWELAVSPQNFESHLKVLKKKFTVISVEELTERLHNGKLERNAVAITFDDGYLNNYTVAKPLLEQYHFPATFFITDDYLVNQQPFWWDELEHLILHTERLPQTLTLNRQPTDFFFDLKEESVLNELIREKHSNFVAYEPPTLRAALYYELWQILSPLRKWEQDLLMHQIREWAGNTQDSSNLERCMSLEQLQSLAGDLFTIGAHTKAHPALSYHSKEVQQDEIWSNKAFLETALNEQMDFFAYPSGNFNDTTLELVKEAGFKGALTTNPVPVKGKTDVFRISRFQVNNWNSEKFERKLKQWSRL